MEKENISFAGEKKGEGKGGIYFEKENILFVEVIKMEKEKEESI